MAELFCWTGMFNGQAKLLTREHKLDNGFLGRQEYTKLRVRISPTKYCKKHLKKERVQKGSVQKIQHIRILPVTARSSHRAPQYHPHQLLLRMMLMIQSPQ
jgi:hypothetical protein